MRTASPITAGQDHLHAVCNDIGERLRLGLSIEPNLPARLQDLLAKLSQLECDVPSIIEGSVQRESPVVMGRAA